MNRFKGLNHNRSGLKQKGATTVEYVMVTVLLVVVIAATVILLEDKSSQIFRSVGEKVSDFSVIPTS